MKILRVPLYSDQQDEAFFDAYLLNPTIPNQKRGVIVEMHIFLERRHGLCLA